MTLPEIGGTVWYRDMFVYLMTQLLDKRSGIALENHFSLLHPSPGDCGSATVACLAGCQVSM